MNWSVRPLTLALPAAVCLLAACATRAPDAPTLIRQAQAALGPQPATLVVSGRGTGTTFGQAWQPQVAWPGLNYSVLTRAMNFDTGAFREEFARSRAEVNGGGAVPLMGSGEQRATAFSRDGHAWNAAGSGATPAPVALPARQHDLWTTTPHGALRAAARHGATSDTRRQDGVVVNTLTYTAPGEYAATLVLDSNSMVTRIESTLPNPVLGDTPVVTEFSDYRDIGGGRRFPMRIRQSQGGYAVMDWTVADVKADTAVDISVPDNVRSARENVAVEKVADGVWFLGGGSHNSVAIETSSQIILVESPLYDGRTVAVFDAANKLAPGKTVRTVINSHHHFDHAGGLRTAVAEGAVLITSEVARPYYQRVFANPNRVAPDRLARSGRTPQITGVSGKTVLNDALRPVEIHEIQGSVHAQGFLMVWLPKEKLLIEADAYTPGPPGTPAPAVPNANALNLVQNLDRLGLAPERILPLHGRVVPASELYVQVGRRP